MHSDGQGILFVLLLLCLGYENNPSNFENGCGEGYSSWEVLTAAFSNVTRETGLPCAGCTRLKSLARIRTPDLLMA
jgi:hypothetical protein